MADCMVEEFLKNQQFIQRSRQQRPKREHNMPPGFDDFFVTERIPGDQEKFVFPSLHRVCGVFECRISG